MIRVLAIAPMGKAGSDKNNATILTNRRATHDYAIEETFEAGMVLVGSEVKSLREGRITLGDAHVEARQARSNGPRELFIMGLHIHEYRFANRNNHEPRRPRKLLLNRREIDRIARRMAEKGFSCIPLRFYFKQGHIKVEIGLGKGKRQVDKRHDIKAKDAKREMARATRRGE